MSDFSIGIDAGGSFVDTVLVEDGRVVWDKKFPSLSSSFKDDLVRTLSEAASRAGGGGRIAHTAFCTTLATNALVNGTFRPASLFLIGYPDALVRAVRDETKHIPELTVTCIDGGHDRDGRQKRPLAADDISFAAERMPRASHGVGISSFYSVRNPEHEIEAKRIIRAVRDVPCVCGSELSISLNAVRRAVTCGLSASLIPIANAIIGSVVDAMRAAGITAPLLVMRGDGCLMSAETACLQPIHMLLSGPAASAIGADELFRLSRTSVDDRFISIDMGGTTADITEVIGGRSRTIAEGGSVGGYRTMVETSDVRTVGLGGDSAVRLCDGAFSVGPDRVVPIAALPEIRVEWRELLDASKSAVPCFIVKGEAFDDGCQRDIFLEHIARVGAEELGRMMALISSAEHAESVLAMHERAGRIRRCSFTPTDACAVLGTLDVDAAASLAAAELIAARAGIDGAASPHDVAAAVKRSASEALARTLMRFVLERAGFSETMLDSRDGRLLIDSSLDTQHDASLFGISVTSMPRVVFLGAPAPSFADDLAALVRTECMVFEHGSLGGAVGVAAARRRTPYAVSIRFIRDEGVFRAHMPFGVADFDDLEAAVEYAKSSMKGFIADDAGGEPVSVERRDITATFGSRTGRASTLVFGADLTFIQN